MKKQYCLLLALVWGVTAKSFSQGINQLWGAPTLGGPHDIGTLISLDGQGRKPVIRHEFSFTNQAAYPDQSELREYNGKLYGMTMQGGDYFEGAIFELDPLTGAFEIGHSFDHEHGASPSGSLTLLNGKFYGLAAEGGEDDYGVLFEWDPATGVYTVLFNFSYSNGTYPYGSLILSDGLFYGTASEGGIADHGVIFRFDPSLSEDNFTLLHEFSGPDGSLPYSDLTEYNGKFYGMTNEGGVEGYGVIFEFDPDATEDALTLSYEFNYDDGGYPYGYLTERGGKLYGMTSFGGLNDEGVLFAFDPAVENEVDRYQNLYDFSFEHGAEPYGSLALSDGKLYGLTSTGGLDSYGNLFVFDPDAENEEDEYLVLHDFSGFDGSNPYGTPSFYAGKLYGMTGLGGAVLPDAGTIFEWEPTTGTFTKILNFMDFSDGGLPLTGLTLSDGKLLGTTTFGGTNQVGTLFEYDPEGNSFTQKADFSLEGGYIPAGSLTEVGGKLYGITGIGGEHGGGTLFEWDPATETLTTKFDFVVEEGDYPMGTMVVLDGKLYGSTTAGGEHDLGVIFEWNPASDTYTNRYSFSGEGEEARSPFGGLAIWGSKLYGLSIGVDNNVVSIFEWDPAGGFTEKYVLEEDEGYISGGLVLYEDRFYGLTSSGGVNGDGTLFSWDPANNAYETLYDFAESDEQTPQGRLTVNNGKLYGITTEGGADGDGAIFEFNPATSTYTKTTDLSYFSLGYFSSADILLSHLTAAPAPVAPGSSGSCEVFTVLIDATNSGEWVPVTDAEGRAIAEIKANGNELGEVEVSFYVNEGDVRSDGSNKFFLDRNITLNAENEITGEPVDLRFYILEEEYVALAEAYNTLGTPTEELETIDGVALFKNELNNCGESLGLTAEKIVSGAEPWVNGYVFTASVSSFSSFYFAPEEYSALPVELVSFDARLEEGNGVLYWVTANEERFSHFQIERSPDGRSFTSIGQAFPGDSRAPGSYLFTDKGASGVGTGRVYYRLKMIDLDGSYSRSGLVALSLPSTAGGFRLYPNPANALLSVNTAGHGEVVSWKVFDVSGRTSLSGQADGQVFPVDISRLSPGIYFLQIRGKDAGQTRRFIKR